MGTWLRANATEVPDDPTLPGEGNLTFISALLPIAQLTTAMDRPGIYRIRTYPCHFPTDEDEVEDLGTLLGPDFEGEGRMPRFTGSRPPSPSSGAFCPALRPATGPTQSTERSAPTTWRGA